MDTRSEIREFLTSRPARIAPEQAGLNTYGSRRVAGLRREEVAVLAGVSVPSPRPGTKPSTRPGHRPTPSRTMVPNPEPGAQTR